VVAPIAKSAGRPLSSKKKVTLSRVFIVMIGGFVLYWGLFYKGSEDIWDYMAVTGAIYFTGAFALLLGGLYWKRASSTGAFLALIGGIGAIAGLSPVQDLLGIELSSARVGLFSILATLFLMVVGSLFFPDRKSHKTSNTPLNHVA
jgi:SSS family solute:Na+ symporter